MDGDKVVGDNCHSMIVNGELLKTFGSGVDQSQTVSLSRFKPELRKTRIRNASGAIESERAIEVHLPIDEIIV
jgi:hypothetical protein